MLHPRFGSAAAALAIVLAGCSDDASPVTGNGPAFEGVSYVVPDSKGSLVVAWKPAPDAIDYRVYVSKIQGRELKTVPAIRTNGTSVVLTPEESNLRYYVVVRAANAEGYEDANTVEKSAVASPDTTPPSFAGLKAAAPDGNAGVKLTWDLATDDLTPSEAIVYDIYAGRAKTSLVKVATTLPGDSTIAFAQLGGPGDHFFFSARARDVAGNTSEEAAPVESALGPDATPPDFEGCDAVVPQGARALNVTWKPATDNATPEGAISYEIYLSKTAGGQDLNTPAAKVTAATSATITNLDPASTYYVLCKARDGANNLDVNRNEKSAATGSDVTPPTFDGLANAIFDGEKRTVTLQWGLASDDQTDRAAIVYDVYESKVSGAFDFTTPRASSAPGAPTITLTDLASRSTLYWVVRARDAAGNHDANLVEMSGTTTVSFAVDVQSVFDRNCAVVGCHVTGPAPAGLNLARGFSYAQTVDAVSREKPIPRVDSSGDIKNSWLWIKITGPDKGALMPAPQTGNTLTIDDQNIIREWIEGKAKDN